MKRQILATLFLCAGAVLYAQSPAFHVTLLGTGVPTLNPIEYVNSGRVNTAVLIETGPKASERMLFDCGQGAVTRLLQSGGADPIMNPNAAVDKVFISHLHSDHYSDLGGLYIYGWLFRYDAPLRIWGPGPGPNGPFGISSIAAMFRLAYDADVNIRAFGFKEFTFPVSGASPISTELTEGVVYRNQGVTVTAFLVDHSPVTPSYGFRVDYAGRSVVYSGDTCYNSNLIKYSQGADVLIHEIYGWDRADSTEIYDYHTPPSDYARVMTSAAPKMSVMTHIALPPGSTSANLAAKVKAGGYNGNLLVGTDLMTIDISAAGAITSKAFAAAPPSETAEPQAVPVPEVRGRRLIPIVD